MSKIARRVASTPERSCAQTWAVIVDLLAPEPGAARIELQRVEGVACTAIADEAPRDDAFIVWGGGPRVHVTCVFGDDATNGTGVVEDPLPKLPIIGDWRLSIPCLPEDVEWMNRKLKTLSARVTARALGEGVDDLASASAESTARAVGLGALDLSEFRRT